MTTETADFATAAEALEAGKALLAERRSVEALAPLIRATELDNYDAEAYRLLGQALQNAGWQEQAIKALIRSVELNDRDAETFELLAGVYTSVKKHEEAGVCLRRCVELVREDFARATAEKPTSAVPLVVEDDIVVFDLGWKGEAEHCWLEGRAQLVPLYATVAVNGAEPPAPEDVTLEHAGDLGLDFLLPYLDETNAARLKLFPREAYCLRLYRCSTEEGSD